MNNELFWRSPPGVTRNYRQGRFGQLHYRLAAPQADLLGRTMRKTPLLLLHSIPNSSRIYNQLLAEMGRDRIAIAIDIPGFGLSDPPFFQPSIDDYSACIGEFITEMGDEFGFQQVDLFGYQLGSKIATRLARQKPKFVRRIVLVSAPVYTDEEITQQQKSLNAPLMDPWPSNGEPLKHYWEDHWRGRDELSGVWLVHREVAEHLFNLEHVRTAELAALAVQHHEELPLIEHPLLMICLGDDLRSYALRAKSLIRNGKLIDRQYWADGFLDVRTNESASLLRDFLDGVADDRGQETLSLVAPPIENTKAMSPMLSRGFYAGPYGPLHYRLAKGPAGSNGLHSHRPIVLLHMSPNSSRVFDSLLLSLAASRSVLALDTPGFGESEAPHQPIGIEEFAAVTLELIDALGFDEVDVLGYHTGAMTAIELALLSPVRIRHVVQISSPVYTPEEQQAAGHLYRARELQTDGSHLVDAWRNMQKFYTKDVPLAVLARNFTSSLRGGPMSHWGHQAAFAYPLAKKLPLVAQTVLVINPEDDLVDKTRRAPELLQRGRLHELPGRAHGFIDQMTEEFTQLLEDFLDEI